MEAISLSEWIRSTSRLAQRHSITTDNWLYWMQDIEDLKNELIEVQEELASLSEENAELREKLEGRIRVLLSKLSMTWMNEDIRDWYDIHPSDVDENLNSNSVLFFRNDGTLVNPLIVEWVGFNFTEDIDEPFFLRGEKVSPRTKSITGTTLHPLHPMIHGSILGNEYVLQDGQEFIPSLYMAFVGSTQESSGVIVKKLISGNEILRYFDESRTDINVKLKYSSLLMVLTAVSNAIDNLVVHLKLTKYIIPDWRHTATYAVNFLNQIEPGSVVVGPWTVAGTTYSCWDVPIVDSAGKTEQIGMLYLGRSSKTGSSRDAVGTVDYDSGEVVINSYKFDDGVVNSILNERKFAGKVSIY